MDSSSPTYDATLASGRWGFHNTGAVLGPDYLEDFDIDAPEAWELQRGDPNVVVAVFDDGADVTHEDLYLNIFLNNGEVPASIVAAHRAASTEDGLPAVLTFYDLNIQSVRNALNTAGCRANGDPCTDTNDNNRIDGEDVTAWWSNNSDDDGNGFADDLVGWNFMNGTNNTFDIDDGDHGTPVAGLIAAIADNNVGIAGAAHKVRILPIRGTSNINKIFYAISFPEVKVINESQAYRYTATTESEINALLRTLEPEGVIYIASMGNHNAYFNGFDPSRREEIVSVSNFISSGIRASGSYGSTYGPKNDIAAPGSGMYSLSRRTQSSQGATRYFGGTSAAAPVVAGVAALIASQNDSLAPEQIRQALRMTASDPVQVPDDGGENTPGWDIYSGWGLVNAHNAIVELSNGKIFPEANILSVPMNYLNIYRQEGMAIYRGNLAINAFMGLPTGGNANWTLKRSEAWDMSNPVSMASQNNAAYSDASTPLHTINTDTLNGSRYILELEVNTIPGATGKDRAVLDLPRAYIANLKEGDRIIAKRPLEGFAYGPGFVRYRILVAPGWSPAATDFQEVFTSTTEQAPVLPTEGEEARTLLPALDIFALPVTLPASGEATLRVETTGSTTWTFDEKVIIDNTQPPQQAGFPVNYGDQFSITLGPPTAVDLNGDGTREIILAGLSVLQGNGCTACWTGVIDVFQADGTPLSGWPVKLPTWEFPTRPVAVGDVDGDGRAEIVVRTTPMNEKENIRIFNYDGTEVSNGWPVTFDSPEIDQPTNGVRPANLQQLRLNAPVLADMTLNGRLEILVSQPQGDPEGPGAAVQAYASDGSVLYSYTPDADYSLITQPAVGDIDGDGETEVAAIAYIPPSGGSTQGDATLYVWKRDGTQLWKSVLSAATSDQPSPPVLVNIDGDIQLEVVAAEAVGEIKTFDHDGTVLAISVDAYRVNPRHVVTQFSPQIDPNNEPAVVFPFTRYQDGGYNLFAEVISLPTANTLAGWTDGVALGPVNRRVCHHPVIADIVQDAAQEIMISDCNSTMATFSLLDLSGNLLTEADQWPLYFPDAYLTTPLITDLDHDNDLELVVHTHGNNPYLYVYDLPKSVEPGVVTWGEYGHDPHRSGNYHGGLRILSPTTTQASLVGPFNDPQAQSLLLVRTYFLRGTPANSQSPDKWRVVIGSEVTTVREVKQVQGEHWLLVEPVVQNAAGTYPLRVEFHDGGIRNWHGYRDAVRYEVAVPNHSQIAVIDRSGSMGHSDKLPAAKVAARFFMESAYDTDEVGVVFYDHTANDELGGLKIAGTNRVAIADAITNLNLGGSTSIGAGIGLGINILNNSANGDNRWGMTLISDGLENTAPFWIRPGTVPPVRPQVDTLISSHPEFKIDTVALGADADQGLLSEIAQYTGGTFYPVYLGNSLSLFNRLADVYHYSREKLDHTQRILTHGELFPPGYSWQEQFYIVQGSRRLQLGLNWDRYIAAHGKPLIPVGIEILRPNGRPVSSGDPGVSFTTNRTDIVVTISAPEPGNWTVKLANTSGVNSTDKQPATSSQGETVEALLTVSAEVPFTFEVLVGRKGVNLKGMPYATLLAYATDNNGFVKGANFAVDAIGPDKQVQHIIFNDNGTNGDDMAGDGIFTTRTFWHLPGSYLLNIKTSITGPAGTVNLSNSIGIYNRTGSDRDRDGIPDSWEQRHAPNCRSGLNPHADLDGDGLDNITEWRFETDPRNPDSDGDGINDGEEYNKAQP